MFIAGTEGWYQNPVQEFITAILYNVILRVSVLGRQGMKSLMGAGLHQGQGHPEIPHEWGWGSCNASCNGRMARGSFCWP